MKGSNFQRTRRGGSYGQFSETPSGEVPEAFGVDKVQTWDVIEDEKSEGEDEVEEGMDAPLLSDNIADLLKLLGVEYGPEIDCVLTEEGIANHHQIRGQGSQ